MTAAVPIACEVCTLASCPTPGFCQACRAADALLRKQRATEIGSSGPNQRGGICRRPEENEVAELGYKSFLYYEMSDKGLFWKGNDDKRDTQSLFISGAFEVLGRVRNPKGEGWARLLRWSDGDKRVHIFSVLDADLHGEQSVLCGNLASRGLKVSTSRQARAHLIGCLNEVSVEDRVTVVERTGWHEVNGAKVFVLPSDTIGPLVNERVILQGATAAPFDKKGTLADWRNSVGSLVAGSSRAVLAVSVGFVGPLLGLLGQEGAGFNLYGQSSTGKTTLAKAAASVWGKGDSPGFVRPWRSTANALEATAAQHTDTLLVLDELGVIDPRQVLRVCDSFGLVAAAGELARELDIVPWDEGAALAATGRCFNDWFDSRGGKEASEIQAAIAQVRLFIEQHGDARFEPMSGTPDRPVNNRAGWRKGEGADRQWLIPPETWKSEVAVGNDPTFVARLLAERGMLKRAQDGFQCVEKIQGRPHRVYVLTAGIIAELDDE